jgi:hypothetical protein
MQIKNKIMLPVITVASLSILAILISNGVQFWRFLDSYISGDLAEKQNILFGYMATGALLTLILLGVSLIVVTFITRRFVASINSQHDGRYRPF